MNTLNIAWKETKAYFSSPMAYVIGSMFLVLTGIFFVTDVTRPFAEASVRGFVNWTSFFILFLAPLLTMRQLAENLDGLVSTGRDKNKTAVKPAVMIEPRDAVNPQPEITTIAASEHKTVVGDD